MKTLVIFTAIGASLILVSAIGYAAAPANAPVGATGLCKDGSFYSGPTKKGACKGHKGVKEWYAEPTAAAKPAAQASAAAATAATAPATPASPAKAAAVPATPAAATPAAASPPTSKAPKVAGVAAPGGGAGKVWINKSTKVYHCPGDRWYGKTKEGEYVSEAEAVAQGAKPDHGKACK